MSKVLIHHCTEAVFADSQASLVVEDSHLHSNCGISVSVISRAKAVVSKCNVHYNEGTRGSVKEGSILELELCSWSTLQVR